LDFGVAQAPEDVLAVTLIGRRKMLATADSINLHSGGNGEAWQTSGGSLLAGAG
jgi:hypothetical protein